MKILFLLRSLNIGGVETQLVVLAKGLRERGHEVLISTFYTGGVLEKEVREAGVSTLPLYSRGRWDILCVILRFVKILKKERPDIVHSYLYEPNLVAVLAKLLRNNVRLVWGVASSWMDSASMSRVGRVVVGFNGLLARFPEAIISNSQAGYDYHASIGWPAEKMRVIRNGVDVQRFCIDPEARDRIRSEWKITQEHKLIGMIARLDPVKDHPLFLRTAASLATEWENLRFVCIGDGPEEYRIELREMGVQLGLGKALIWAGARGDMSSVYNALDLAVNCSHCEGLSNVICEAMACGVPCVVTDVGDSAWVVGDQGEVVPPRNWIALADAIKKSLFWNAYDPGQVRQRIMNELSGAKLVSNTEHALKELVRDHSSD